MDNPQKNNFSEEDGNLEVVDKSLAKTGRPASNDNDGLDIDVSDGGKIVIGRLNIFAPLKDRHEKFYKESKFHLWADLILAAIILCLGVALVWITFFKTEKNIFLESKSVNGAILSGRSEIIEVAYGNRNSEEIEDSSIAVSLPDDFRLEGTEPANLFDETTGTFRIGDLGRGASGKVRLKGATIGGIGDREVMAFVFNFKKNGKPMSVLNSFVYKIEGSVLEASLSLPQKVYQGSEFKGSITLKNSGLEELSGIELAVKGAEWEIGAWQRNVFPIDKLKPGSQVKVDFAALPIGTKETADFTLETYLAAGGRRLLQHSAIRGIAVNIPKFKAEISTEKKFMHPEDEVSFKIRYRNDEAETADGIRFAFASANPNFEINSISLSGDSQLQKDAQGLFLPALPAGRSGEAEARLDLKRKKFGLNDQAVISLTVDYAIKGEKISYKIQSQPVNSLSNFNVKSAGYYYSPQGDQLGIGPLPPVTDIPTRYWIFWEAGNLGNDLKDLSFSAQLPEEVTLTDNKSLLAGNLQFGQVGRKLIWVVDEIDKEGGNYKAGFEVEIIPKDSDVGRIMALLTDIRYSVTDTFCGEEIKGNLPDITTSLTADRLASGKGKVTR